MTGSANRSDLAGAVVRYAPGRAGAALALLVLASATEGVSLLVFVPTLQLLQPRPDLGAAGGILEFARNLGLALRFETALALCAVLVLVRALCVSRKTRVLSALLADFVDALRERLFHALALARWSHTMRLRGADIEHVLTDDIERVQISVQALFQLAQAVVLVAAYGAFSLYVSPPMTVAMGVLGAALLAVQRPLRRAATRLGERYGLERAAVYRALGGLVSDLKLAKSYGAEAAHARAFGTATRATRLTALRYAHLGADAALVSQTAAAFLLGFAVLIGARGFGLGMSDLLVLVVLVARIVPALASIQRNAQDLRYGLPGYARARQLHRELDAAREPAPAPDDVGFRLVDHIALDAVSFRYTPAGPIALSVDTRIPARVLTAVIGPSGAGKTTLADLLLALIEPTAGTLRVDGRSIRGQDARAWRARVGYVPQDAPVFAGSVRANLLLAQPDATDAQLWHALAQVAADDFVSRLPGQLDAEIGDRGLSLSGGERQRLAVARALLRRPLLLVLDEATSALDAATETQILTTIAALRGQVTTIAVAHRPAVLAHADHVLVLDSGRLVEQGPASELHARPGSHTARLARRALPGAVASVQPSTLPMELSG